MTNHDAPVALLSSGRSGSTLLQKLLNTNPELTIWGEHAGILNGLSAAWQAIEQSQLIPEESASGKWLLDSNRPINAEKWTAWDGSFSKNDFRSGLKAFIKYLFYNNISDSSRWGFKEIRYRRTDVLDMISDLFPKAQVLILIRDPVASCVSFASAAVRRDGIHEDDYPGVVKRIAKGQIQPAFGFFKEVLREPGRYGQAQTLALRYESLVSAPHEKMEILRDFLSLGTPFNHDAVESIMSKNIVSERARATDESLSALQRLAKHELQGQISWLDSYGL